MKGYGETAFYSGLAITGASFVSLVAGAVVTDKEKKLVTAGDMICIPAGEKHWHGATEDSEFSHIVVTMAAPGGHQTEQFEK